MDDKLANKEYHIIGSANKLFIDIFVIMKRK